MGKEMIIEPGKCVEIRTKDGKIHSGTILSWEEIQEEGWESRKWEVAAAATQSLLTHEEMLYRWTVEDIAEYSFKLANALVKKFKEGGDVRGK